MPSDANFPPLTGDFSVRRNNESRALDAFEFSAVEAFHLNDIKGFAKASVLIGKELERKPALGLEPVMRLERIPRDPENLGAGFFEGAMESAEIVPLGRAARRVVFRIKVNDERLSLE